MPDTTASTDPGRTGRHGSAVVVPVKAFTAAKVRLSEVLDADRRAALARAMATRVVSAAAPLPVAVVCDDEDVTSWAATVGAEVIWTPGTGLDGAVTAGVDAMGDRGVRRVAVVHADLPFATDLAAVISCADAERADVVLVPDRRRDGTNVAVVPTDAGFRFAYGPGSFAAHEAEARRLGLRVVCVESEALGWDVDRPEDLDAPPHLGTIPLVDGVPR